MTITVSDDGPGIPPEDRELLELGALLHDIGEHVARNGHDRHSAYLIENGGLRGFAPDEIKTLSVLARYHVRGTPKASFDAFGGLAREDRERAVGLTALLRIADALDASHAARVTRVGLAPASAAGLEKVAVKGAAPSLVHAAADGGVEIAVRAKGEKDPAGRRVARLTEGIAAPAARAHRGPAVKLHERPQVRRLLSPLGIDTRRLDEYPLPFWAVLAMVLIAAKAATSAITLLFGLSGALDVLLTPVLFVLISRKVFATFHARRSTALFNQLPDALSTIVRCVRVGIPVQEAFRIIATDMQPPISVEFGRLADRIALGVAVEQALPALAERSGLPEFHFFASALALQARTGGGLAQTLETPAEVIRKRVTRWHHQVHPELRAGLDQYGSATAPPAHHLDPGAGASG